MKRILFSLYILLSACAGFSQEVVELKLPTSNQIVLKFMFRNGSICDPAGREGMTNLTANALIESGTASLTADQIKDITYPWAAQYYATVDKEVVVFTFAAPTDNMKEFFDIISGWMFSPSFAEEDFQRVKSNIQNYVDQVIRSSSDEEYSKKALEDFLFRGSNYQHMVQGTSSGVNAITRDAIKAHYRNFFTLSNLTIGIAGNYNDTFLANVKAACKKFPAGPAPVPTPGKARTPNGIEVEIVSKDKALGSAVFTGFPLPITRSNDEFAALMIANSWLGEHRKSYSHLYQKIRADRSMNYGDYSYIEWYDRGGSNMLPVAGVPRSSNYFSMWLRPVQTATGLKEQYKELSDITVGHAHFAIRMAIHELDELVKNGMNKEDFNLTKQFLQSYTKLYAQTPDKRLGFLLDSKFYGRKDYLFELDVLLSKVTLEEVNAAIKKYWQTKNMFITIVTDKSETAALSTSLKENKTSPMSYSNTIKAGMPAKVLDEDKKVENFPLNIKNVTIVPSADTFKK